MFLENWSRCSGLEKENSNAAVRLSIKGGNLLAHLRGLINKEIWGLRRLDCICWLRQTAPEEKSQLNSQSVFLLVLMLHKANGKIAMGFAVGFVLALTISNLPRWFNPHTITDRRIKRAILFGDSITQEGSDPAAQGWVAALTAYWIRRVDVVNRGFGGYTSRWGLKIFDKVVMEQQPDIVFVFFGANDATVPEHSQHVPIEEYKNNLRIMVRKAQSASITTFLLTPPPVYEPVLERRNKENGKRILNDRLNDNTQRYVEACKEIGRELSVPVVDNWTSMGGASPERAQFLRDGLHLSAEGNRQLFQNVLELISGSFQHLKADKIKLYQPHWSEIVEHPGIL